MYSGKTLQNDVVNYLTEEKTDRNQIMSDRYQQGDTLAKIADDYGISVARVHQIISKKIS